jgi:hypothetical protein
LAAQRVGMSELIPQDIDNTASGKTWESLAKSRKLRSDFIHTFGCVPTSILVRDSKDEALDLISKHSYSKTAVLHKSRETNKHKLKVFGMSGSGSLNGGLSKFPQNIGRLLVRFYCPENGVIFDPFAGHNSRMQLCYECGRNYIGIDVCHKFMQMNRKVRHHLFRTNKNTVFENNATIQLIEGSSAKVNLPDNYADFTITSPPYWDVEKYGPESEQLGNAQTYEQFLELLSAHIKENYRILKPDTFCCWCVNDFKKDGIYRVYHADLIPLFLSAGFTLHTIYIIDLVSTLQSSFVQSILKYKAFPKRHEYCMVFYKLK